MMTINKRQLLSAAGILGSSCLLNGSDASRSVSTNSAAFNEFVAAYKGWMEKENESPVKYLLQRNIPLDCERSKLRAFAEKEFQEGDVFNLQGLILSKVEVAFVAVVGESLTLNDAVRVI